MAIVNIGLARTRDLVVGRASVDPVDCIGFGTDPTPESPTDTKLGAGTMSYWKLGAISYDDTNPEDPSWEMTATWGGPELVDTLYELGTSAGGLNTAIDDSSGSVQGSLLYTRKRIGGANGIGKTADIELVARVKVIY